MTKVQRIWNFIIGLIYLVLAVLFFIDPVGGLSVAIFLLNMNFLLRGLQNILYFLTMTRHMVGGITVLLRGLIFLDLSVFTTAYVTATRGYLMLYLITVNIFSGVVEVLRGREENSVGTPNWKYHSLYGAANLLIAAAVLIVGLGFRSVVMVIFIYAAGLVYKGISRIASVFRKTAIVFIQ